MSIKFICSCGKRLRARDDMASRRSFCPRCGAPVGVPALEPTHSGATAGPMTPAERIKHRRNHAPDTPLSDAAGQLLVALKDQVAGTPAPPLAPLNKKPRRPRIPRQLEAHWYQCLAYPFRAWPLLTILALVLTILTSLIATPLVPMFLEVFRERPGELLIWLLYALGPLAALGYVCGTLDCVLAAGIAGEVKSIRWPGYNLASGFRSLLVWFFCFLAGPVLPFCAALAYWYYAGEFDWLDGWIIAELIVVAFGYWFFVLVTVYQREQLLDANPLQVAKLVQRIGLRLPGVIFLAALFAWLDSRWLIAAIELLHVLPVFGFVLLLFSWSLALFCATFLMRMVGVWCYRAGPVTAPQTPRRPEGDR